MADKTTFKVEWVRDQFTKLRKIYSQDDISNEKLKQILLEEYDKRKMITGRLYNNITNSNMPLTVEGFINYFLNNDYILSGYCTLFKNQYESKTVAISALEYILNQRKVYKKKMEAAEKGSNEYIYNRVMQLTFKILANSYYGITSMQQSIFYNSFLQNSCTTSGQDLISTAIYLVEAFVANNERFRNLDEIIEFVSNVSKESNYNILNYLDNDKIKTTEQLKQYLINHCDSKVDDTVLFNMLSKQSSETLNKIYYKNQIIELFKNKYFADKLQVLCSEGKQDQEFRDLVVDICNYNHIAWDRFIRVSHQKRKGSLVTDTDSTFIYLGNLVKDCKNITKLNDTEAINLNICNTLIYILSEALKRTFAVFTDNCKIPKEFRVCYNW